MRFEKSIFETGPFIEKIEKLPLLIRMRHTGTMSPM
jgi:hypothetical protein